MKKSLPAIICAAFATMAAAIVAPAMATESTRTTLNNEQAAALSDCVNYVFNNESRQDGGLGQMYVGSAAYTTTGFPVSRTQVDVRMVAPQAGIELTFSYSDPLYGDHVRIVSLNDGQALVLPASSADGRENALSAAQRQDFNAVQQCALEQYRGITLG